MSNIFRESTSYSPSPLRYKRDEKKLAKLAKEGDEQFLASGRKIFQCQLEHFVSKLTTTEPTTLESMDSKVKILKELIAMLLDKFDLVIQVASLEELVREKTREFMQKELGRKAEAKKDPSESLGNIIRPATSRSSHNQSISSIPEISKKGDTTINISTPPKVPRTSVPASTLASSSSRRDSSKSSKYIGQRIVTEPESDRSLATPKKTSVESVSKPVSLLQTASRLSSRNTSSTPSKGDRRGNVSKDIQANTSTLSGRNGVANQLGQKVRKQENERKSKWSAEELKDDKENKLRKASSTKSSDNRSQIETKNPEARNKALALHLVIPEADSLLEVSQKKPPPSTTFLRRNLERNAESYDRIDFISSAETESTFEATNNPFGNRPSNPIDNIEKELFHSTQDNGIFSNWFKYVLERFPAN